MCTVDNRTGARRRSKTILTMCLTVAIGVGIFAACNDKQGPTGPHSPKDTDQCASACANFRRLGCEAGNPVKCTPGDPECQGKVEISCEQFCKRTQEFGVWLNPACPFLKSATSGDVTPPLCPEVEQQCAPR
jgi:hypothetical protein